MSATQKIVKSTKNGQITIPIEFRKQLGNEGEALWQVTLDENELRVSPVRTVEGGDSDWYERLYERFAPARAEAIERGYTDEEINSWIDEVVAEVHTDTRRNWPALKHSLLTKVVHCVLRTQCTTWEYIVKLTASSAILERLAADHRRVLSDWRALILLRRATYEVPPHERRWTQFPQEPHDLSPLFRQMQQRGEIKPIKGVRQLYEVIVPYARQGFIEEEEVLFEMNPYAVLSHFSALAFHGLTEEMPKGVTVVFPADGTGDLLPLGTEPRDWEGLARPNGRTPPKLLGRPVTWTRIKPERFFGFAAHQPHGYLVRVTTPERTLLDALQYPELCGGIANVLRAWVRARDTLDLDALVHHVDRFGIGILRQRVGYILEELGLTHPLLETWQGRAQRGGSSRLVAATPFAPEFSERWSLSLNGPVAILRDEAA